MFGTVYGAPPLNTLRERMIGLPVEDAPPEYEGQVYVRAAREGDGYIVHLYIPLAGGTLHARITAEFSPGWSDRVASVVRAHNSPEVSGAGEPAGWCLPSGHYFPPPWMYPAAPEVGDLGTQLGGLLGGALGTAAGGPAGTALGAGLGSALGGLIESAAGGGGGGAQVRPASLPPGGSPANRARILQFIGAAPGMDAATIAARLATGAASQWHPDDLADARAMLAIAQAMTGPVADLQSIIAGTGASTAGTLPADASQGAAAALSALLGGQAPASSAAPILATLAALQRAAGFASSPTGAGALGALSPDVMALMGDSMAQVSAMARALTGDPSALGVVDQAVARASQRTANAIQLVRAMLAAWQ